MKKGKSSSRQLSEKKGSIVLVPLLSQREAEKGFVEAIAAEAKQAVLLLVIDTAAMSGQFGFAAGEIAQANTLMQKVKAALAKRKVECDDIIEWGDTLTKIEHLALLRQAEKILLAKQDNQFFQKLLRELREKLPKVEIETVVLPEA